MKTYQIKGTPCDRCKRERYDWGFHDEDWYKSHPRKNYCQAITFTGGAGGPEMTQFDCDGNEDPRISFAFRIFKEEAQMNFSIEIMSNGFLVTVDSPREGITFVSDYTYPYCSNFRKVYCKTHTEVRELLNSALTEFEKKHQPDTKKS